MNRRGFLGSFLGTVIGVPFYAKLITEPPQQVILPDWRMAFREVNSGELVQAPGVKEIVKLEDGYDWIAAELKVERTIQVGSTCLFDKHGRMIMESRFPCSITMMSGDTLKVNQKLSIEPWDLNTELARKALSNPYQLADAFLKYRRT